MDIPIEPLLVPQLFHNSDKPFHRIIGIFENAGAEKQPFDVIAPVKIHRQFHNFFHGECGPLDIVAAPRHAESAIVDAMVGQQYFK